MREWQGSGAAMSTEANKALVRRYAEQVCARQRTFAGFGCGGVWIPAPDRGRGQALRRNDRVVWRCTITSRTRCGFEAATFLGNFPLLLFPLSTYNKAQWKWRAVPALRD